MMNIQPNPEGDLKVATLASMEAPPTYPAALAAELMAQQGRYRQLAADFDNYRKRTLRDNDLLAAVEKDAFIRNLLPVLDNLERALNTKQGHSSKPLRHGLERVMQELTQLLQSQGVVARTDEGQCFDPHWHEAISLRHVPGQTGPVVIEVFQRGYSREGKMFRPAKVVVNDPNQPT